jgi:uncharacterized protein (TIGR03435 family)
VTGAHVKKRLRAIRAGNIARGLNTGRKLLLAAAGMLVLAGPIAIGIVNPPLIRAQAQAADAVAFEVASVKPLVPGDTLHPGFFAPGQIVGPDLVSYGRFVFRAPLQWLILFAYNLPLNPGDRLSGAPEWTGSREGLYDIEATGEFPAGLSYKARMDRAKLMAQALLADRFKLKIRRETKEIPVYVLTVAKGGPKLQRADIEEKDCPVPDRYAVPPQDPRTLCHFSNATGRVGIHARAVSISDLVRDLENFTGRPLLDKTGIEGLYHIETTGWQGIDLGPPAPGAKTEDGTDLADVPTLFMVLGKLGLKMESTKAKSEVYVIDHIEKPTEN